MKIPFNKKEGYSHISDDTLCLDVKTLFLKTEQNSRYYNEMSDKPSFITPAELMLYWLIDDMKVVGVTGTNGKTTVTAAIYSFLLDLDE